MIPRQPLRKPSPAEVAERRRRADKQRRYRANHNAGIVYVSIPVDKTIRTKLKRWNYLSERDAEERNREAIAAAVRRMLQLARE